MKKKLPLGSYTEEIDLVDRAHNQALYLIEKGYLTWEMYDDAREKIIKILREKKILEDEQTSL